MQAIVTKYLGATNSRGSRIKATCEAGSATVAYDYGLSDYERHKQACDALRLKLAKASAKGTGQDYKKSPWLWPMVGGGMPGGYGYAFVFVEGER
ncbi:hypothetical protein EBR66_07650 [bacterium]|nr:hypothetical protein [bacterium]